MPAAPIHPTDAQSNSSHHDKRFITIHPDPVPGDYTFHEYVRWLHDPKNKWYTEYGFDKRVAMGFMGGGLMGVSTALSIITDKTGKPVGESMPHEGGALARFHDAKTPKKAPHTAKCVWDSPHSASVAELVVGAKFPPNKDGATKAFELSGGKMPMKLKDADGNPIESSDIKDWKGPPDPTHCLLPQKRSALNHTADAISAFTRALEAADGERGGGALYCTDYFGLRERVAGIKRQAAEKAGGAADPNAAAITPADLQKTAKVLSLEPPIMMLKSMCAKIGELALVVPYPEDARLEAEATLAEWRKLYPSRYLLLIPVSGKFKITTSFNILAALTHASSQRERGHMGAGKSRGALSNRPRPTLVGVASGGYGVLEQMADVSNDLHSVRLVLLQGTGRIADLWAETWPKRGEVDFNPDVAAKQLQNAACFPPSVDHIECMRQVLAHGELILHPIENQSSTLQRLCNGILMGDRLLQLAAIQHTAYSRQKKVLDRPRMVLVNASIILGFASTVVAILVPPDTSQATLGTSPTQTIVLYYASIILPAVMLVVDQVEAFLGTLRQKEACERAAGLVESQAFRYKTHAGSYSDPVLSGQIKAGLVSKAADIATARQLKLAKSLNDIQIAVAKSGAQVSLSLAKEKMNAGDMADAAVSMLKQTTRMVGAKGTKEADELDGDEYLTVRVEPEIEHSTKAAFYYLLFSLVGRIVLFAASALGTVLATVGFTSYVAVTVSLSTSVSRWLTTTRVEERRQAHMKAASELNCAKLRWEALPNEARAQQSELDNLVLEVEGYLEATLPPASKDDHDKAGNREGAPAPGTAPPDKKGKAKKGDDDEDDDDDAPGGGVFNMLGGTIKDLALDAASEAVDKVADKVAEAK